MSDTAAWIASAAQQYGDGTALASLRLTGLLPTSDKHYVDSNGQTWPMGGGSHTLASGISRILSQVTEGVTQALYPVQSAPFPALKQRALAMYGLALAQSALTIAKSGGRVTHPHLQGSDSSERRSTIRNATWISPPSGNQYAPEPDAAITEFWTPDDLDHLRYNVKELCSSIMRYSRDVDGEPATYMPEAGELSDAYGNPLLVDGYLHNDCKGLYKMAKGFREGLVAEDRQAAKASNKRDKQREREATERGLPRDKGKSVIRR